jgi:protein O-mannosyl-transferase
MLDHPATAPRAAASRSPISNNLRTCLNRLAPWIAAAVALITFANSPGNDYAYDDVPIVKEGVRIHQPGKGGEIWTTDYWHDLKNTVPNRDLLFRPLTLTSIRLVRTLAGDSALPQRLLNIALHALIAALVVFLCKAMGIDAGISLFCGVIFAALPIHTEVVNAIVGRADMLATLFLLLATGAHARSIRWKKIGPLMAWRIAASVAAFAAMASKENGVAAAPLVVLADAFIFRIHGSRQEARRWLSLATLRRLAYLLIPIAFYLGLRYYALGGRFTQALPPTQSMNALAGSSLGRRTLGVIQLWGMYWAKTIWPATLNIKYTLPDTAVAASWVHPHVLLGLGLLLAGAGLTWKAWLRHWHAPAYLFAALLITYFPTSNSLVLIQEFFAERIWYMPSLFAVAFLGALTFPHILELHRRKIAAAGFMVVIMAMVARCWARNVEWKNNETLYAAAYRDAPTSVGVLQLYGDWLTLHDRVDEGIDLLRKALQIDPDNVDAHRSLANAYLAMNNSAAAAHHLEMAARLNPQATPYNNLGVSYARQGNFAEAEQMFQKALPDPSAAAFAHYNLGLICNRTNRVERAIAHWEESLRLDPGAEETVDNLGRLYISLRRTKDAARIFRHGTERSPTNPRFWHFLAMILATSQDDSVRDGPRALEAAQQANTLLNYADANALAVLAAAEAESGAFKKAVETAHRAMTLIKPESEDALSEQIRTQIALYERGEPYRDPRF